MSASIEDWLHMRIDQISKYIEDDGIQNSHRWKKFKYEKEKIKKNPMMLDCNQTHWYELMAFNIDMEISIDENLCRERYIYKQESINDKVGLLQKNLQEKS